MMKLDGFVVQEPSGHLAMPDEQLAIVGHSSRDCTHRLLPGQMTISRPQVLFEAAAVCSKRETDVDDEDELCEGQVALQVPSKHSAKLPQGVWAGQVFGFITHSKFERQR
jgi:hypothetical protein